MFAATVFTSLLLLLIVLFLNLFSSLRPWKHQLSFDQCTHARLKLCQSLLFVVTECCSWNRQIIFLLQYSGDAGCLKSSSSINCVDFAHTHSLPVDYIECGYIDGTDPGMASWFIYAPIKSIMELFSRNALCTRTRAFVYVKYTHTYKVCVWKLQYRNSFIKWFFILLVTRISLAIEILSFSNFKFNTKSISVQFVKKDGI